MYKNSEKSYEGKKNKAHSFRNKTQTFCESHSLNPFFLFLNTLLLFSPSDSPKDKVFDIFYLMNIIVNCSVCKKNVPIDCHLWFLQNLNSCVVISYTKASRHTELCCAVFYHNKWLYIAACGSCALGLDSFHSLSWCLGSDESALPFSWKLLVSISV